jgi:hypothetical protein
MRRFAFFFGATEFAYNIYVGDIAGTICFGAISLIALISKAISSAKKARDSGE